MTTDEQLNVLTASAEELAGGWWVGVIGAPGWFVGGDGRIVSVRDGKRMRVLKPIKVGRYLAVGANGKDRRYVHQLVCEAFRGPRPHGAQVRHLDGNPHNNACTNLVWGTPKENAADKIRHGTDNCGERNATAKLTWPVVTEMRQMRASLGWSYRRIGEHFGVAQMTAYRAVTGQCWGRGGNED
jgi:hypothetical protein